MPRTDARDIKDKSVKTSNDTKICGTNVNLRRGEKKRGSKIPEK